MSLQLVDLLMQRSVPRHELIQSSGRHDMIHTAHSSCSGNASLEPSDGPPRTHRRARCMSCSQTRSSAHRPGRQTTCSRLAAALGSVRIAPEGWRRGRPSTDVCRPAKTRTIRHTIQTKEGALRVNLFFSRLDQFGSAFSQFLQSGAIPETRGFQPAADTRKTLCENAVMSQRHAARVARPGVSL